jgi:hypothetical protein
MIAGLEKLDFIAIVLHFLIKNPRAMHSGHGWWRCYSAEIKYIAFNWINEKRIGRAACLS